MGALTFGESFDCIKNADWHPLIKVIFDGTKIGYYLLCSKYWPLLAPIVQYLIVPKELKDHRKEQSRLTKKKTDRRKSMKPENADLISGMLQEDSAATEEEYHATAATLIAAGGETTATLLSGVTYFLLTNPDCMRRVVDEVRESFGSVSNISYVNVNKLSYLLACLNEAFRMYPPVADAFPRNTSSNTEVICGKAVPPNTVVRMTQYATYRNPANFARPNEFLPERWLDAEENGNKTSEFLKDKRGALQPFHVGPRNCIGQNLAYFEMRLMMALLLWNFDMELLPESEGWMDQKSYLFWEKSDLMVRLTPRVQ